MTVNCFLMFSNYFPNNKKIKSENLDGFRLLLSYTFIVGGRTKHILSV